MVSETGARALSTAGTGSKEPLSELRWLREIGMLTSDELQRYTRQLRIIGKQGQESLKAAKVFIAGAGGLCSSISMYLAAAGVGNIGVVDQDIVEPRLCSRRRSEVQKTLARRDVGAILCRRHSNNYGKKQNRETSVAARIFKPQ